MPKNKQIEDLLTTLENIKAALKESIPESVAAGQNETITLKRSDLDNLIENTVQQALQASGHPQAQPVSLQLSADNEVDVLALRLAGVKSAIGQGAKSADTRKLAEKLEADLRSKGGTPLAASSLSKIAGHGPLPARLGARERLIHDQAALDGHRLSPTARTMVERIRLQDSVLDCQRKILTGRAS